MLPENIQLVSTSFPHEAISLPTGDTKRNFIQAANITSKIFKRAYQFLPHSTEMCPIRESTIHNISGQTHETNNTLFLNKNPCGHIKTKNHVYHDALGKILEK